MSLDIQNNATVEVVEVVQVQTETTRVRHVVFNFDNLSCFAVIGFGTGAGESFVETKREYWMLSGPFYLNSIYVPAQGDTAAEALIAGIGGVVMGVEGTPGRKEELIASGELRLVGENQMFEVLMGLCR